jgi:hypothetical protein
VALIALVVAGAAYLALASTLNTTLQLQVAETMRGKVMALYIMGLTGSVPVGSLVQGWLADAVGPRLTVAVAGSIFAGAAVWLGLVRDQLGRMDHRSDVAPTDHDAESVTAVAATVADRGSGRAGGGSGPGGRLHAPEDQPRDAPGTVDGLRARGSSCAVATARTISMANPGHVCTARLVRRSGGPKKVRARSDRALPCASP